MTNDLFSASRPPGTGMRLPPWRGEPTSTPPSPWQNTTPEMGSTAQMPHFSTEPPTAMSSAPVPTVPPPAGPNAGSWVGPGRQAGQISSFSSPRQEERVPTVVQVGPPSHGTPVVDSAPQVGIVPGEMSKQEDLSFITAPMTHGEVIPSEPRATMSGAGQLANKGESQQSAAMVENTADMTQSTISNDVSYEPTFGADALIRPYDPSNDSFVDVKHEPLLGHQVPQRSSDPQAISALKSEGTAPKPALTAPLTTTSQLDGSSTTSPGLKAAAGDAEMQQQTLSVQSASLPIEPTPAAQRSPPIFNYHDHAAPAPPLDPRFMAGLGPVLPSGQSMEYLSTGTVSRDAAPPMPTAWGSSTVASSPSGINTEEPVTVIATTKDSPDVVFRPVSTQYPDMKVVHITPAGPGAKTEALPVDSPVPPSWTPNTKEAKLTSDVNANGASGTGTQALSASAPVAAPAPDTTSKGRVSADAYRLEWVFGPHVLVYNDACTRRTGPVPVAYTFDDWFVERPRTTQEKPSRNNSTAVVVSCPSMDALETAPLYLGVFSSTLVPTPEASYVFDMAAPLDFEVPPNVLMEENRTVTVTGIRRNMRLLSRTKHQVVAATVHRLVAEMTSGSSPGLMQDVFLGYRQYLGAGRLLELLFNRMEWSIVKIGDATYFKVALSVLLHTQAALWHWLHYYYEHDFARDEVLTRRLVQWMADQDYRVQFWQYANNPSAIDGPPMLKEVPSAAVPEQDEELPNNDPSERMHSLWALVQALVPTALLPDQDSQNMPTEARNKVMLRKSRSLTRMLALSNSPTRSRKHHSRWPSVSGSSVLAAVGSIPAMSGPTASSHMSSSSYKTPGPATAASPSISETTLEPAPQGRAERSRSLKSLRRMWRRGTDAPSDGVADDGSPRGKMDAATMDDEVDDTHEQDVALQLLEQALSETPRTDAFPSPRHRDGPIQWIPSHTGSSWKEAQRLSIVTAQAMLKKNPTAPASRIQQRDTFLLCQRSSTIARQLGTIERQLLACVQWHELAEPSWEQHTVQQEQWQREYQEYIVARIRAASGTEDASSAPSTAPKAEGVHMLIARFNRACAWVATHIVTTTDLQERVMVVNKFIRIAWHCFRQGNMESLCQIMFGLQSPWVARLQRTWGQVALWELRAFDALRRFTSPRNQFAYLRQSMVEALDVNTTVKRRFSNPSTASAPYVPFFGLLISDLTTNDGLASFVDSSLMPNMIPFYDDQELSQSWDVLVNVYRLRIKACIVREFITLQRHEKSAPECPMELPILVESLQLDTLSAAAIQSASLALEP